MHITNVTVVCVPDSPNPSTEAFGKLEPIHKSIRGYNLPAVQASYIPCVSEIIEYLRCRRCTYLHANGERKSTLPIGAAKGVIRHRAFALTVNVGKADRTVLAQFVKNSSTFPESLRENSNKEASDAISHSLQVQNLVSRESRSEVYFSARRIGIRGGKIDILEPDFTPVELKTGRFRSHLHKIQATLYTFLLEFNEGKNVDEAAIVYSYYSSREQFAVDSSLRVESASAISDSVHFYNYPFPSDSDEGCGWCNSA